MIAGLIFLAALQGQAGPPLHGFKAGELKFEAQVSVGAPEQKTGIRGDGTTVYVVQVDGVGHTPGGRSVDGLYTFVDSHASFPIPARNSRINLLIGTNNVYRDWEFYKPGGGDAFPAFQTNNSYKFLWKPSPGDEVAVVSPNLKWTSPADDPLSGTYFVKISTAVPDDGKAEAKTSMSAVDCQEFRDNPGDIPVVPSLAEPKPYWVGRLATEGQAVKAVAADGATMVIVRSVSEHPGKATFTIQGPGALYPVVSQPFSSAGSASVETPLRPTGDGKFAALALYRSPDTLALAKEGMVRASVAMQPSDGAAASNAAMDIKLVRPPVILVHGTYDNPIFCWDTHEAEDEAPVPMKKMLEAQGFRVFLLDWEETNGMKDPSSFQRNEKTLLNNKGGISEALYAYRKDGIAVTQADIVCHSQGGVISRVYARGYNLDTKMPESHPHFNDPVKCAAEGCWYHRANNFSRGDIHRFITISSTHRGSDVCKVFPAFANYQGTLARDDSGQEGKERVDLEIKSLVLEVFLTYVDKQVSGITTEGFKNQIPGSRELRDIGPTPVSAHAIACVATDENMKQVRKDTAFPTAGMGNYYGKLYKIFKFTSDEAMLHVIKTIGTPEDLEEYKHELDRYNNEYAQLSESGRQYQLDKVINLIRKIVFSHDENDCTVAMMSSFGGLSDPYRYKAEGALHGWAPRYNNVQQHVLRLLTNDGSLFDRRGFPGAYSGIFSRADTFSVPTLGSPNLPTNPVIPTTETGPATAKPGMLNLAEGQLGKNEWTEPDSSGGTARIENDQVVLDAITDDFGVRTFSKQPISGDFDLVVDYTLDKWAPSHLTSPTFDIYLSPTAEVSAGFIQVSRSAMDENEEFVFTSVGNSAKPAIRGKTGRLRVQRKGSEWSVWQWDGSAWKDVATFNQAMPGQLYLGLGATPNGVAAVKVSARPRFQGGG